MLTYGHNHRTHVCVVCPTESRFARIITFTLHYNSVMLFLFYSLLKDEEMKAQGSILFNIRQQVVKVRSQPLTS